LLGRIDDQPVRHERPTGWPDGLQIGENLVGLVLAYEVVEGSLPAQPGIG
jgi:hypothetical protein